jgi:hypothetical protein
VRPRGGERCAVRHLPEHGCRGEEIDRGAGRVEGEQAERPEQEGARHRDGEMGGEADEQVTVPAELLLPDDEAPRIRDPEDGAAGAGAFRDAGKVDELVEGEHSGDGEDGGEIDDKRERPHEPSEVSGRDRHEAGGEGEGDAGCRQHERGGDGQGGRSIGFFEPDPAVRGETLFPGRVGGNSPGSRNRSGTPDPDHFSSRIFEVAMRAIPTIPGTIAGPGGVLAEDAALEQDRCSDDREDDARDKLYLPDHGGHLETAPVFQVYLRTGEK